MERRHFIKKSLATAIVAPYLKPQEWVRNAVKTEIGIQISAASFVDEGVEKVLDLVQEKAQVNTIYLTVMAYNDGLAGRQLKGFPFPDHGKKIYLGDDGFKGGYYSKLNPKYHKTDLYKSFLSPDFPDFDMLGSVIPAAQKRGIKVLAFFADNIRHGEPVFDPLLERKMDGSKTGDVCMNNMVYRNLIFGIIEDCIKSYALDGLLYRSERIGPLSKTLGLTHLGFSEPICFCSFCQKKAKKEGLNMERIKLGYTQLQNFVKDSKAGKKPLDGYHISFLRLLLKCPEILQWQTFQTDSLQDMYRDVYQFIKKEKPNMQVGWAIPVNNGLNPIYRAEQEWDKMAVYSDFLKVTMYESVIGARMERYINNATHAWYGDLSKDQMLELEYALMGYNQPKYSDLTTKGFSTEYITNENKRIKTSLSGTKTKVLAGIDVDLPSVNNQRNLGAIGLKESVKAAFAGGADGIILARKYSEMNLSTLVGAGEAVKELGLNR